MINIAVLAASVNLSFYTTNGTPMTVQLRTTKRSSIQIYHAGNGL